MKVANNDGRIRVLHVLEALEGGTARFLVDIVRHVEGIDHHVVIPSWRVGGETDELAHSRLSEAGASIHEVEMRRSPIRLRNARALFEVRRVVREARPAVVHSHSSIGGLVGRVAALGGPVRIYSPQGITSNRKGLAVERMLGRATDYFVAASPSEAGLALEQHLIRESRLVTIPNGIDCEAPSGGPDLRALLPIPSDAPIVGTISRLVWQKAPEDFVQACATVHALDPTAHFVLIGGGYLHLELHKSVRHLGLEGRFHHISSLPNAANVLDQFAVFALSSRFEGGPYSPLEAMRAGTPVVLTDVVGSRDLVEHDVSGLLVPAGDPVAIGEAIAALLADEPRRARLGAAGRERHRTDFDVRAMAASLQSLYEKAARARS